MGAPNTSLIPAAMLHMHNGLTARELATHLAALPIGGETNACVDWSQVELGTMQSTEFKYGEFGVYRRILGLKTVQNIQLLFSEPALYDSTQVLKLIVHPAYCDDTKESVRYTVATPETILGDIQTNTFLLDAPITCPTTLRFITGEHVQITKIVTCNPIQKNDSTGKSCTVYEYTCELQPINVVHTKEDFSSLEDLQSKYPHLAPEQLFNTSQTRGECTRQNLLATEPLCWQQNHGRYIVCIDDLHKKYKATRSELYQTLYSSIVLTAAAIRSSAWQLFGWYGYNHTQRFLADHPVIQCEYEKAMFNWWISHMAIEQHWTNTQLLRFVLDIRLQQSSIHPALAREHSVMRAIDAVEREGLQYHGYLNRALAQNEKQLLKEHMLTGGTVTTWLQEHGLLIDSKTIYRNIPIDVISGQLPF